MKVSLLFYVLLTLITVVVGCPATAQKTDYQVKPADAALTWTGHAEVGSWAPTGTIRLRSGSFRFAGGKLLSGRFEIDMTSMAHTDAKLQEHLRGSDFFDVEKYPTSTFALSKSAPGKAVGTLTLKGVENPITFPVTITQTPGGLRVKGIARIDRTQFGVTYNSSSFFSGLGDYAIANTFEVGFDVVGR